MRVWLVALLACGCGSAREENDASASDAASDAMTADVDAAPAACESNSDCTPDTFCYVPCKTASDLPHQCWPRGTCDDAGAKRTCGCDGHVYGNPCLAMAAGITPSILANDCPAPSGAFRCYDTYCDDGTYCQHVGASPNPTTCVALPPACLGSTDCACFGDAGGCGACHYAADAGFVWSCTGD